MCPQSPSLNVSTFWVRNWRWSHHFMQGLNFLLSKLKTNIFLFAQCVSRSKVQGKFPTGSNYSKVNNPCFEKSGLSAVVKNWSSTVVVKNIPFCQLVLLRLRFICLIILFLSLCFFAVEPTVAFTVDWLIDKEGRMKEREVYVNLCICVFVYLCICVFFCVF